MQLKPGVLAASQAQHGPQQCRCCTLTNRYAACRVLHRSTMLRLRPAAGGPATLPQARSGRPLIAARPRALATSGGEKGTATSTRNTVSKGYGGTAAAAARARRQRTTTTAAPPPLPSAVDPPPACSGCSPSSRSRRQGRPSGLPLHRAMTSTRSSSSKRRSLTSCAPRSLCCKTSCSSSCHRWSAWSR